MGAIQRDQYDATSPGSPAPRRFALTKPSSPVDTGSPASNDGKKRLVEPRWSLLMPFASTPELRSQVVSACRVLSHFRIVEGFGHITVRLAGHDRMLITPR